MNKNRDLIVIIGVLFKLEKIKTISEVDRRNLLFKRLRNAFPNQIKTFSISLTMEILKPYYKIRLNLKIYSIYLMNNYNEL